MKPVIKISALPVIFLVLILSACTRSTKDSSGVVTGEYSVFAWNDLGMHCLNPTYDKLVILPPFNNITAQVVKRGNPPQLVTSGVTVSYKLINNSSSYGKRAYGGFWDNSLKLFGVTLAHDIGLKGYALTGDMTATGNYFIAEGVPVVPVDDGGTWNPFQVAEITVKDGAGAVIAQTQATVPTSDEINCAKCHGTDAFTDILAKHDAHNGTRLSDAANQPVLCASCHPSPALGITTGPQIYLSRAIHGFHSGVQGATCYDCHPGATTKCSRSLRHTSDNGNCTTCHGDLANVAATITSGRVPWASEPACVTCHTGVDGVSTGTALYRNSDGHGNLHCSACHGSPHAMIPTSQSSDNYQSVQYQGFTSKVKSIGSCGVCHNDSRGGHGSDVGEFSEEHGGTNPGRKIGCHACHTSVSTDVSNWPHAHTWKNSN
jgi:hypothetical protein